MKKGFFLYTLAGVLLTNSAQAENGVSNTYSSDIWSGNYVGISLGSRNVEGDWTTTSYQDPNGNALAFGTNQNTNIDSDELFYSIYIGRNWQIKPRILTSVEGSIGNASNNETHVTIPGVNIDYVPDFSFIQLEEGIEATLRGRIGYLIKQDIHVYSGLGVAAMKVDISATCPADTDFCNPSRGTQHNSELKILTGWTASIGLDGVLQKNIFWRLEYSYADYGDVDFSGLPAIAGESFGFSSNMDYVSDTLTLGFGYKF